MQVRGVRGGVNNSLSGRAALLVLLCGAAGLGATGGLSGCAAVGPDYRPPETAMPEAFSSTGVEADPNASLAAWWTTFDDPVLASLIERGIARNLDLALAEERLREARALRGIEEAGLLPSVDATGAATRNRSSTNAGGFGGGGGNDAEFNLFEAGLDASWELDIFGGVRRAVEASSADLDAAAEDRRDVLVSVVSEIARNYVDLRASQQRLLVTDNTIRAQTETLELADARLRAGLSPELEVAQSRALLATREAQRPLLRTAERAALHRLGVLLGEHPGALAAELGQPAAIPRATSLAGGGVPSELLRRRPDIRRAERRIAAATARIGVATADLFPRFSLTGSFGLRSEEVDRFGDSESIFWGIGPSVRWNLFDAGRIRRTIDAANSRERQAVLAYQQTVLTSLEEAENALTALVNERERNSALQRAVEAQRLAVSLAEERYRSGVGDFLNVLESQRQLYDSEDQLTESDGALSRAVIALYKALGGGWEVPEAGQTDDQTSPTNTPGARDN